MADTNNERRALRSSFTRVANLLETELNKVAPLVPDKLTVQLQINVLQEKFERLDEVQNRLLEALLEPENAWEVYEQEFNSSEAYKERWIALKTRAELFLTPVLDNQGIPSSASSSASTVESENNAQLNLKLPRIEPRKFDGEVHNWLAFWSQFKHVHEDPKRTDDLKFEYLLLWVVPGSKAAELVYSYPATAENYPKVIKELKERFACEDILTQVYVRELLGLVLENANKSKEAQKLHVCARYPWSHQSSIR